MESFKIGQPVFIACSITDANNKQRQIGKIVKLNMLEEIAWVLFNDSRVCKYEFDCITNVIPTNDSRC